MADVQQIIKGEWTSLCDIFCIEIWILAVENRWISAVWILWFLFLIILAEHFMLWMIRLFVLKLLGHVSPFPYKEKNWRFQEWWWQRTGLLPRTNGPSMCKVFLSLFPSKLNSFRVQNQVWELSYPYCQIVRLVKGMLFACLTGSLPDNFQTGPGSWHGL